MVYPALLAAVGDVAHPTWRATSVGVYRFWRDLGYAVGALMAGVVAAMFGLVWAVHAAGILTLLSGLVAWALMNETLPGASATTANALRPAPAAPGSTTLRALDSGRRFQ
jgi:MFS family permease